MCDKFAFDKKHLSREPLFRAPFFFGIPGSPGQAGIHPRH
jgi:hypothetical protein